MVLVKDLQEGDEVVINYGFEDGEVLQKCKCAQPECWGWLHRDPKAPPPAQDGGFPLAEQGARRLVAESASEAPLADKKVVIVDSDDEPP